MLVPASLMPWNQPIAGAGSACTPLMWATGISRRLRKAHSLSHPFTSNTTRSPSTETSTMGGTSADVERTSRPSVQPEPPGAIDPAAVCLRPPVRESGCLLASAQGGLRAPGNDGGPAHRHRRFRRFRAWRVGDFHVRGRPGTHALERLQAEQREQLGLDLTRDVLVLLQEQACVLAALADALFAEA